MLKKELSQFAESGSAGSQIAEYISSTYTGARALLIFSLALSSFAFSSFAFSSFAFYFTLSFAFTFTFASSTDSSDLLSIEQWHTRVARAAMSLCAADKSKDELEQEPDEEDEQQEAQARANSVAASESASATTPNGPSGTATATGAGPNGDHGAEDTHEHHEHQQVHAASSLEGAGTGSRSGPQQQAARAGKKLSMPAAPTGPQAGARKHSPDKQLPTGGSSATPNNTHNPGRVADIVSPLHVRPSCTPVHATPPPSPAFFLSLSRSFSLVDSRREQSNGNV